MLPSCVPATSFEDNGATIDAADTEKFIENPDIYGLGEFMNSPAVRFGDDEALRKLKSCLAAGKIIDGHLVTANEDDVNVYALKGIKTDHENVCEKDVYEKIKRGFYVQMREGTSTAISTLWRGRLPIKQNGGCCFAPTISRWET